MVIAGTRLTIPRFVLVVGQGPLQRVNSGGQYLGHQKGEFLASEKDLIAGGTYIYTHPGTADRASVRRKPVVNDNIAPVKVVQ